MLFPPHGGYDTTWGGPSHQVHTRLYLDISYTGVRLHLRTECEVALFFPILRQLLILGTDSCFLSSMSSSLTHRSA